MSINKKTPYERYSIIIHGIKNKNIAQTCKTFGISRTIYYKWYNRFQKYGLEGLKDVVKERTRIPNKTPKYIEDKILKIVKNNPTLGPRSIKYIMQDNGFNIGETGIYNVMKRFNLNLESNRINFSKDIRKIVRKSYKKEQFENFNFKVSYTGYLLIQWTNYLGYINDVGKIYQIIVLDAFSNYAFGKIYKNKKLVNVKDIMEAKVIPALRAFDIKIENVVTKNSREYTTNWRYGKHKYEQYLKDKNIKQFVINKRNDRILSLVENFQQELYRNIYINIIQNNENITFNEIQKRFQEYLRFYNNKRKIKYGINKGKTPIQVIINGKKNDIPLPVWLIVDGI